MFLSSVPSRSFLATFLLSSLLIQPIFCAPEAPRHVAFAVASGAEDVWEDLSRTTIFSAIVNLPVTVLGLAMDTKKGKKAPRFDRVEIRPGDLTVLRGETTNFAAAAFNGEEPVFGVDFRWSVSQIDGESIEQYRSGIFNTTRAGRFVIKAASEGREAQAVLTVVDDPQYAVTSVLRKRDIERTEAERQQIERWREGGAITSTPVDSRRATPIVQEPESLGAKRKLADPNSSLSDPLGWDGGNWSAADDRNNWVGRPAGSAEDARAGNGNFTFAAPVASLGGRGLDVDLNMYYNSRVWSKAGTEMLFNADAGYPAAGWTLGLGKMYYYGLSGGCMLVSPDGTRRSFAGSNNLYNQNGLYYHWFEGNTTDGSLIKYGCQYYSYGGSTSVWGWAMFPDGKTMLFGNGTDQLFPYEITDANGNYIQVQYKNGVGPEIDVIWDTLGRGLGFHYDSSDRLINVTGAGYNGTTRTFLRLHYDNITLGYDFGSLTPVVPDSTPDVIDAIYYPTSDTGYWLPSSYYSSYGMLAAVEAQRGMSWSGSSGTQGTVTQGTMTKVDSYNYPMTASASGTLSDAPMYSNLTENWEGNDTPTYTPCAGANTTNAVTCYSISSPGGGADEVITVVRPDGSKSKQTSYTGTGFNGGMWYQTEILSPSNAVLDKTKIYMASGYYSSPRTTKIEHTDDKSGTPQTTTTEFSYGSLYNQVSSRKEYGYAYPTLFREQKYTYENGSSYTNRNILNLVTSVEDYDGSGNRLTRTEYGYDASSLVAASGITQFSAAHDPYDGAWDSANAYRGDLTSVTTYETVTTGSATGAIMHDYTYDIAGNQRTASTDCCQQIETVYSTATQFSLPDSMTRGSSNPSSPDRITQSFSYDTYSLVATSITDYNGLTTTMTYDAISRPLVTTLNSGAKTTVTYSDSSLSRTELVQKSTAEGSGTVSNSTSFFNGRGQVNKSTYQAGTSNHNATSIKYDVMGRQWKVSRPYDTGSSPSDWSESAYDYLGRVTTQTAPDGSANSMNYNPSAPSSASSNVGVTVITSDAWGRERWVRNDAYGRLVEVVEPDPGATSAAVSASGNLSTTYSYDTLDRLTTITQGSQTRSFRYDSLGRMTRQKLAEQTATINDAGTYVGSGGSGATWSEAFVYDTHSNLTQRTDARGVKTNISYLVSSVLDPLNRLQSISYDTSTADTTYTINSAPTVSFEYMTTGDKTRVKKVDTAGVAEEENAFDSEGRIAEYKLTLDSRTGNDFETDYTYDSAHRLTEIKYPKAWGMSGNPRKSVVPSYDVASRLTQMNVDSATYLDGVSYNTSSQVTSLTTGSSMSHPRVENYSYDSQTGLLTGQTVKNTAATSTYLDLTYSYARGNSHGSVNGKTGQLTKIVDNLNNNRDKLYEFDSVGRLMKAHGGVAAGATGVTANWTQTYTYDRYGNRTATSVSGDLEDTTRAPRDGLSSVSVNTATNRVNTSGWEYDLAGNLIRGKDGTAWQKFEYDAAGRLVKIRNDSNVLLEEYTYGASRERLKVETSSQRRYFAWGGQNVVAEYIETGSGTTPEYSKSYIYAGSRLFMTATKASSTTETKEFHHPDRLGTQLVTEGSTGSSFRQSTMPFGTAISTETTGNTNQVFTSYDRSSTTGLDYAQNRTYSKGQSRFTQVDPIAMASASLGNPQSNNLFAYVQNMPTDFVDPSGLFTLTPRTITFAEFCIRSGLCQGTPTQSQPEETGGGGSPPPPDETCLLTVTQTPVGSAGSSSGSTGHLYITTTYQVPSEGISSTQGYRAGPQGGPMSGFGNINPQYGRYDTNFADYPKGSRDGYLDLFSQVFNGSCAKLDSSLQKTSDWILFSKVNYELLGPNSNSYVRTLLHYAGLEVGSMRISAVGWGTLIPLDPAQEPTLGYPRYR